VTRRHDFEAKLRFLTPEEGGRQAPVQNGYRADFRYLDDPPGTGWMIHPREFITKDGDMLPSDTLIIGDVYARMYILTEHYRMTEHRIRIHLGTQFEVVEGNHVVAEGIVTKIVGLNDD